ncbi:MAG: hypothetical protein AB2L24_00935 [Mangrovibacterium sp.]
MERMKFILFVIILFSFCFKNNQNNKIVNVSENDNYNIEENKTEMHINYKDSSNLIIKTAREIARNKSFREAIPFLEKEIENNSTNPRTRIMLQFQVAEYYLLYYLVDEKDEYFAKAEAVLAKSLSDSTSLLVASNYFSVNEDVIRHFIAQWRESKEKDQKEILMIKALIEKFKK